MPSKTKKRIPKDLRDSVWITYVGKSFSGICFCGCGKDMTVFDYDCGHVIAECRGGATIIENLRPVLHKCNTSMASMDMNTYRSTYYPASARPPEVPAPPLVPTKPIEPPPPPPPPPPTKPDPDGNRCGCFGC